MVTRCTTAKNKLVYRKGLIEATVNDEALYRAFFYSQFWTQKKKNKFFCTLNNTSIDYLQEKREAIANSFDFDDKIVRVLSTPKIDYRGVKDPIPPRGLEGITLMEHQEYALDKMLKHKRMWFILGQGSGKTFIALAYINSVFKHLKNQTIVIVTKKSVIEQYSEELATHLPQVQFVIHKATKKYGGKENAENLVIMTNYEQIENLPDEEYHTIIYDESQYLNGFTSNVNKAATKLNSKAESTFFLTGTPRDRSRHELFAQFKTALPWLAPTKTGFMERFFELDDHNKPIAEKRSGELEEIIDNLTYGETTEELLGDELPDVKHIMVECGFNNKTFYTQIEKEKVGFLERETLTPKRGPRIENLTLDDVAFLYEKFIVIDTPNEASVRSKLRQLCNGFIFYTDDHGEKQTVYLEEVPKRKEFIELVTGLEHALIFTQFKPDIEIVSRLMKEAGKEFRSVDNTRSEKENAETIRAFQDGEFPFLIIQNKTGGVGLHVVNTNNIIFYALPESHLLYSQALYRTRRKGQKADTCYVYSFVTKGTVEKSKLVKNLEQKEAGNKIEFEIYRRRSE